MTDEHIRAVLHVFGFATAEIVRLGNAGGFSGARLWRVTTTTGELCLRAWPANRTVDEIRTIHGVVDRASRSGLSFVPAVVRSVDGRDIIENAGRVWDLTTWMPGRADFAARPTATRLRAASTALANLHRVWESPRLPPQRCPAVIRRLDAIAAWQCLVASGWRPAFGDADPVTPMARTAWRLLPAHVEAVAGQLQPFRADAVPVQPCLCDVWHDHILFVGDVVSGIVDYGGLKVDHVAVDLARLLGSLIGDDAAAIADGLTAYRRVRPFGEADEELMRDLDRTGVVVGLTNWLTWLYRDERTYEDRAAVARRLAVLVGRIDR